MPAFSFYGTEDLAAAFKKMSNIPNDVKAKAMTAAGNIVAEEQRRVGEEKGIRAPESNAHILDKIKVNNPKIEENGASVTITFSGSRKRGRTSTRNAEIAFINEFGKRGQPARPFISVANKKAQERALDAAADVIHDYIEKQ